MVNNPLFICMRCNEYFKVMPGGYRVRVIRPTAMDVREDMIGVADKFQICPKCQDIDRLNETMLEALGNLFGRRKMGSLWYD